MQPSLYLRDDSPPPPLPGFRWLAALVLFAAGFTLWVLLYPFNFQPQQLTSFLAERQFGQVHKINLVLNVLCFIPFGLLAGWAWKVMLWQRTTLIIALVAIDAAIISGIAEFVQTWLPEPVATVVESDPPRLVGAVGTGRTSSLFDLLANITGGAIGGAMGMILAGVLSQHWVAFRGWLASHPRGKRAVIVLAVVLLARTAPFDATFETSYLRVKWIYITKPTGSPFSATRRWLPQGDRGGRAYEVVRREATRELFRAGLNFTLFTALGIALARGMQEARALRGRRPSGARRALAVCLALVVLTELLQHPIRSRVMDATDPLAGAVGAMLGVTLAKMRRRPRPPSASAPPQASSPLP